jgi:hypothetical protein
MSLPIGYVTMIYLGRLAGWLPKLRGGSWYTRPNATWKVGAWRVYWSLVTHDRHKHCKREDPCTNG